MPPYLAPYSFAGVASALALLCVGCPSSSDSDGDGTSGDGTAATDDAVTTAPDDDDDDDDDATDDDDDATDDDDDATGDDDDDATSDDDDDDTGTGGSSGGGSTGADLCPDATNVCVVPVDDWEGPIAVQSAKWPNEDLECGGEYDEDAFGGATDFDSGTHECTCECVPPDEVVCSSNVTVQRYRDPACSEFIDSQLVVGGSCDDVDNASLTGVYLSLHNNLAAGPTDRCTADLQAVIDPVTFAQDLLGCGGAPVSGFGCDVGEICMPRPVAPFEPELCIWRDGDHECPEGSAFSQRRLTHASFEDDRGCGDCGCGFRLGNCQGAQANLFSDAGCGSLVAMVDDGCTPGPGGGVLMSSAEVAMSGTSSDDVACPVLADDVLETGSVAPLNPTTVCCLAG